MHNASKCIATTLHLGAQCMEVLADVYASRCTVHEGAVGGKRSVESGEVKSLPGGP